jgi:hypothetical protein
MDIKLAEALVAKNLLVEGTEVEAAYLSTSLGGIGQHLVRGEFTINKPIKRQDGSLAFSLTSTRDGTSRNLPAISITAIDGMDPARFASVYDVKADGNAAVVGKRRGRKPKDRSIKVED